MFSSVPPRVLLAGILLAGCTDGGGSGTDTGTPFDDLEPIDHVARFLRSDLASELRIRVFVQEGVEVPGDPWAGLVDLFDQVADKPGGIAVDVESVALPDQDWTFEQYEARFDQLYVAPGDDVAAFDVLALRGSYLDSDDPVLGLSWSWRRMVLLVDPITDACASAAGGVGTRVCEASWSAIARHEAGHLVGLVHNGAPMIEDHEDPEHPHHDPDPECLMYYAWNRADVSGRVADRDLDLCDASLADLAAIREAPEPP